MSNPVVDFFKSQLNKEITQSPSPLALWLKGTVKEVDEGTLAVEFLVREEMSNPAGTIHGGVVAAIMDEVMGATVYTLGVDTFFTTVNLSIDYLSAVKKGEQILAKARVVRKGNTIINVECIITDPLGKLVARGTSNLVKTSVSTKIQQNNS